MTDDVWVEDLRRKWGIKQQPNPLTVNVRLSTVLELIATANRAVAVGTGFCLGLGDTGKPLLAELDRIQRTLNYQTNELTQL